jgi:hypothetical protein
VRGFSGIILSWIGSELACGFMEFDVEWLGGASE